MPKYLSECEIDIFNPYAPEVARLGPDYIIDHTNILQNPFLQILGARWLVAQESDDGPSRTITVPDMTTKNPIITVDFYFSNLLDAFSKVGGIESYQSPIFVFSDLPGSMAHPGVRGAALNQFLSAHSGQYETVFSYESFSELGSAPTPVVPLGCAQSWLPITNHNDRIIFLDEPHETLVDILDDSTDIRVALYLHAVKTCKILYSMDFSIVSFYRNKSDKMEEFFLKNNFIKKIDSSGWIPFRNLAEHYSKATLFFSFFTETHGYAIYENMQLGNGIITYAETFDNYRLQHMQGGPLLSIYNTPTVCANVVSEYYDRYVKYDLKDQIRNKSREKYAAETFMRRLRQCHAFNSPIV
ncbi:hypothetical protein LNAOJCKE_5350 [Methylorubrum aminovorans]|uniref:Uncharacterized protein n=1 Tax=Methylorubrum aminovorans TaxID=269069 RepID=A0ABQ4ULB2_9HYPH|nr:hypothetical protein [Methylorubrum aminovorans]GJE68114.1 hypothetical protein LNAOJCKE_5350 [Methylorubrum aminovorans]